MGRLIPAGTGLSMYKKVGILVEGDGDRDALEEPKDNPDEKNLDIQAVS